MSPQSTARRRLPREEREADILRAATATFAELGFGGASMDSVADACGITKPMLYRYFGSKERLYLACVGQSGGLLVDAIRRAALEGEERTEQIRRGFLAFLDFVAAQRVGWQMLFDQSRTIPGPVLAGVSALRRELADLLATALVPRSSGLGHAKALALISAAEALANWHLDDPAGASASDLADLFAALCAA